MGEVCLHLKGAALEYTRLVTDYETGEVHRISIGEHLTFSETAKKLEVSRLTLNKAMLEEGLCQREHDDVAEKTRVRLHPDAAEKGLGHRIMGPHGPFDVLSPMGREVAEGMLQRYLLSVSPDRWRPAFEALKEFEGLRKEWGQSPLTAQMRSSWLEYHVGDIPIDVVSKGLGVSQELIYRHKQIRETYRDKLRRRVMIGETRYERLFEAA